MKKLLGSTKSKITKEENEKIIEWWKLPHLEITEVVLVHCNIVNSAYQKNSRVLWTFIPNKLFGQFLYILHKNFIFQELVIQSFHISKYGLLIKILNR